MRKRIFYKVALTAFCIGSLLCSSGCQSIDLDKEDEEQVVEYAANVVINHDKNYIVKMPHREKEEETTREWITGDVVINTTQGSDEQGSSSSGGSSEEETTKGQSNTKPGTVVSVNDAFGFSGFTVESAGYTVTDKYPEGNEGFSMVATKGYDLLVLKFNVKNNSSETKSLDVLGMNYSYRCIVNNQARLNAQITALLNGLNTWEGNIEAGQSKELVLVFQVSEDISSGINSIDVSVIKDGLASQAKIK